MTLTQRVSERGMAVGLRALNRWAGSEMIDRFGLRQSTNWALRSGTQASFRAASSAGRAFKKSSAGGDAERPKTATSDKNLFDLTPTDEQEMLVGAAQEFAAAKIRPAAEQADHDDKVPAELLAEVNELGTTMLGVPEELGGVTEERSAVTATLMYEALSYGDMGIAFAALAPAAVSTAISLWGDADQQKTYLPEFVGENPPAAAFIIQEPQPLFDPLRLETTAKPADGGFVINGAKALVPRAAENELLVVAAQLEGRGPAMFIVESGTEGITIEGEPAMGLRAAATGRVIFKDVKVPATALLADGSNEAYREAIRLSRVAWGAMAAGTAKAVLDYVIPYVKEREAFGEPIAYRQGVAFPVADIAIEGEGIRLSTYRAASRADQGLSFARESALARRLTADKGMLIGSTGVQLLGGHGYIKDHPVERWYRDLRAAGIYEGGLLV